ncbi:MAG: DUF1223 domain-containing protein [endosymbiont of Galathealinum brachiosum]|uniref:DUF1223 domain-containing protein n=1 Tax=endosymbiont of Galathealinum brachiosum TaxID=2200906 RepID=A0A370DCT7_9GAMM|nr:MAG: DUF1223 domain-containing protein [endosymbiont of Galathealinum brachiosum]
MKNAIITLNLILSLTVGYVLTGQAQTFQSTSANTQLLELYSSQGCSSCPPAERWISRQIDNPGLWIDFIPLVFHVDYWDYLGWKDPFSKKQYSQRQRTYHYQGGVSSVYTPGMIANGNEWRGWYRGKTLPESLVKPGILSADLNDNNLHVHYKHKIPLNLNVALLGFSIKTDVKHGENSGELFSENFIVLNKISKLSKNGTWDIELETTSNFVSQRYALAIWINAPGNLQPIQATGGWLD